MQSLFRVFLWLVLHSLPRPFGQVETWRLQLCHPRCEGNSGQEYEDQSAQGFQEKGSISLAIGHWSLVIELRGSLQLEYWSDGVLEC